MTSPRPQANRGRRHRCASLSEYYTSGEERAPLLGYQNAGYNIPDNQASISNYDSLQRQDSGQHCHDKGTEDSRLDKKAMKKLAIASGLCFLFIILEVTGGILANSLAIATDAAHMLTDFCSFMISMFSLFIASRAPTKRMSFGWYRAEVMGALVSVMMIWVVTGILVYLAIQRVITQDYEIDATVMLITSALAVAFNIIMGVTLHDTHGHSHGGHGHSHGGSKPVGEGGGGNHGHSHDGGSHGHSHGDTDAGSHGNSHAHGDSIPEQDQTTRVTMETSEQLYTQRSLTPSEKIATDKSHNSENINVRAAFIHVLGDLLQSVGVLIAAYIIYYKPEWKLADPICTFLFSVLVIFTTFNILKDAVQVLMEGTPPNISYKEIKSALNDIQGVKEIHNLRIWSLTVNKVALSVHIAIDQRASNDMVLKTACHIMRDRFGIMECTIQIEEYVSDMDDCEQCQEPAD